MKEMIMTLKLYSMPAAAAKLGYSLPFMKRICQRAFCSGRPFLVLKDANNKYFIEANSLQRYIDSCPDFNPYEIPAFSSRTTSMRTRRWTNPCSF